MLYRPASFRKTAFAVTAAAAIAGASVLASFPANAQQAVASHCDTIKDAGKRTACLVGAIDKDTQRLKTEEERSKRAGAAADVRATAADEVIGCLTDLKKFKERNPEGFAKLGTITRDTACSAAAKIPRPTASLN